MHCTVAGLSSAQSYIFVICVVTGIAIFGTYHAQWNVGEGGVGYVGGSFSERGWSRKRLRGGGECFWNRSATISGHWVSIGRLVDCQQCCSPSVSAGFLRMRRKNLWVLSGGWGWRELTWQRGRAYHLSGKDLSKVIVMIVGQSTVIPLLRLAYLCIVGGWAVAHGENTPSQWREILFSFFSFFLFVCWLVGCWLLTRFLMIFQKRGQPGNNYLDAHRGPFESESVNSSHT